jgi:hypothetical protein
MEENDGMGMDYSYFIDISNNILKMIKITLKAILIIT